MNVIEDRRTASDKVGPSSHGRPEFTITPSGSVRFAVPDGARIEVWKYTRHKRGLHERYTPRQGRRFRRIFTLAEGSCEWVIPESYFGSPKKRKLFRFRFVFRDSPSSGFSWAIATCKVDGGKTIQIIPQRVVRLETGQ